MSTPLPREEFAVTARYIYLNHASAGVLPRSSVMALNAFVKTHAENGVLGTFPYDCRMPEYRETIGRFIGAAGSAIATIPNTSWGANAIALGLDWKTGDEVLLCDNEFPANSVPWLALRRRGVTVRLLQTARERLTPDVLRRELSSRTRVVAVSWVSYADGYRHDLAGLAEVAHRRDVFLCVDAMQAAGVFPIDVLSIGVDALYAGGGKWMLALHGIGFLFLSGRLAERMELSAPGWRSLKDMWDFHNYEQGFSSEAMRLEAGTPNVIGALSLACAIDLFERCPPEAVAAHVLALTDRLCDGLDRLKAEILSHRGSASSGIVTFRIPGYDSIALGEALTQAGIVVTYRPYGIRVSPHGYNTGDEIETTLEVIARVTRAAAATA